MATFTPLPWQVAPWNDTSKTLVVSSGAGSGKSVWAFHRLNALMLKYPGALGLVLRKARQHLRNSSIPMLESITGPHVRHQSSNNRFEYPNGSRIVYGGMFDQKQREALRSIAGENDSGVDFVVMEEGSTFSADDYEEVMGRLRGKAAPWRQVVVITNPDSDQHWICQRFINPHLAGRLDKAAVYMPRCEDNPTLDADYLDSLRSLTGVRRARLYEGRWVRAEGTVYDTWLPEKHVISAFDIPDDWQRFRVIDQGYVNPRVCLWIAVDGDGKAYVYREIYKTKQLAKDFAQQIIRHTKREKITATICDHDAEERAVYTEAGIDTVRARKDVSIGIQATQKRISEDRLFWFRGCLVEVDEELRREHKPWSTVQEFDCYVWKRNPDGTITKEEPEKKNDHGMDALRYFVMHFDRDAYKPSPGAKTLGATATQYTEKRKKAGLAVF